MIDAKMLATLPSADDVSYDVWGVWIPRRGDNAVFTMEVVANFGALLTAELFEKNYNETGDGTTSGLTMEFDQRPERLSITKLGAKELVRFRLTVRKGGQCRCWGSRAGSVPVPRARVVRVGKGVGPGRGDHRRIVPVRWHVSRLWLARAVVQPADLSGAWGPRAGRARWRRRTGNRRSGRATVLLRSLADHRPRWRR